MAGKGRRGISFAWRQHRFFFDDFLLLALSDEKLEGDGDRKGEGVRAWGWGEAHRVRFTLQHCCCALFWTFTYGTYKERVDCMLGYDADMMTVECCRGFQ